MVIKEFASKIYDSNLACNNHSIKFKECNKKLYGNIEHIFRYQNMTYFLVKTFILLNNEIDFQLKIELEIHAKKHKQYFIIFTTI